MAKKELNYTLNLKDLFSKNMQNAVRETEKLDNRMGKVSEGRGMRNTIVGANLMTNAIQAGGRALFDFEKQSISAFMKYEQFQVSMTTMFKGNKREAEQLGVQLQEFAKTTPFELTEVQEATKMMIAYGSKSGSVVDEMRMLGDISSGVGQPLSEIAYLYGTLRTQGRAYAMDIRQFAGRGIPIIEALAKQFKVSKSEVMDLVSKGKVGFPQVEKALKSLTEAGGQFNNMMAAQSKTLSGQVSNLSDSWNQLKISIGESQSGILKSTASWATEMLGHLNAGIGGINNLNKAFKSGGAKEVSGGPSPFDLLNPAKMIKQFGDTKRFGGLQMGLQDEVSKANTALQAKSLEVTLRKRLAEETAKYQSGSISGDEYTKRRALLRDALGNTKLKQDQILKAADANNEQKGGRTGAGSSDSLGSSTEVYGARPQNLTININKLIENFTISTTNLADSTQKVKENVSKAIMEAVNDVNQMVK